MIISKAELVQTMQMAESEQNYDFLQIFKKLVTKCKVSCWGFCTDMQVVFIVCNEEAGVLLCTWFIRQRNRCRYFPKRIFAFPSLIKAEKTSQRCQCTTRAPAPLPVRAVQDGVCPAPRRWHQATGSAQPAASSQRPAGRPCRDTQGPCGPFVLFRHFMDSLWHSPLPSRSGPPASILPRRHRAVPTGRRSRRCPVRVPWTTCANATAREAPAGSRRLPTRPCRDPGPRERSFPGLLGHPRPGDSSRSRGTTTPKKLGAQGPRPPERVGRRACWGS